MRLASAIGVIAVAWAAAIYLHLRTVFIPKPASDPYFHAVGPPGTTLHPSWEDPTALPIAIAGVVVAVGIIRTHRFANPS